MTEVHFCPSYRDALDLTQAHSTDGFELSGWKPSALCPSRLCALLSSTSEDAVMMQAAIRTDLVQSNIVIFHVKAPHTPQSVVAALKAKGVLAICFRGGIRMVTHVDITREQCEAALETLEHVLADAPYANGHANGHAAKGPYSQ